MSFKEGIFPGSGAAAAKDGSAHVFGLQRTSSVPLDEQRLAKSMALLVQKNESWCGVRSMFWGRAGSDPVQRHDRCGLQCFYSEASGDERERSELVRWEVLCVCVRARRGGRKKNASNPET